MPLSDQVLSYEEAVNSMQLSDTVSGSGSRHDSRDGGSGQGSWAGMSLRDQLISYEDAVNSMQLSETGSSVSGRGSHSGGSMGLGSQTRSRSGSSTSQQEYEQRPMGLKKWGNTVIPTRRARGILQALRSPIDDDEGASVHGEKHQVAKPINSTPLYDAIHACDWRRCFSILKNEMSVKYASQVRTWVSSFRDDRSLVWKRLPIHEALYCGAPAELIYLLLELHPLSVETKDSEGNLPLHLAMANNAEREVIEIIIEEYPQAMEETNDQGKLPLECVNDGDSKASPLKGEVLQKYVASVKEIASKHVPKLRDKLFEVSKTIEAAKSELRLAKVELGVIKQQERMRLQNKEKEESRMKEEVMRLRSELESLRVGQEQLSAEKEHWAEIAKKKQQQVIDTSDSDGDDSQRSWIAMEFSEMVSELEQTNFLARSRRETPSSDSAGSSNIVRLNADGRSIFRTKYLQSSKTIQETEIKETNTEATETTSDREQGSVADLSETGDDYSSIRSIREQLERSRKMLGSRSNSEDDDEQESRTSTSEEHSKSDGVRDRQPSKRLAALDDKLSGVLDNVASLRPNGNHEARNDYRTFGELDRSRNNPHNFDAIRKTGRQPSAEELLRTCVSLNHSRTSHGDGGTAAGESGPPTSADDTGCEQTIVYGERSVTLDILDETPNLEPLISLVHSLDGGKGSNRRTRGPRLRQGMSGSLQFEKGLTKISEARWNCNSMADDLTFQGDEEEFDGGENVDHEESDEREEDYADVVQKIVSGLCDIETRNDSSVCSRSDLERRGQVSFAEEAGFFEEAQDGFSAHFSRFDDVVDQAMSRISWKTYTAIKKGKNRRRSNKGSKASWKEREMRHIYVTGEDRVEILSSDLKYQYEQQVRSSGSATMSEHGRVRLHPTCSETGYASEV